VSADRLREAADVLEQPRDALGCSDPYECCLHSPTDEDTYPADRFETATAALLRAVAARHVSDSDGERCYGCREPWPCPEAAAAEALADVILGDNDD